jgi:hypothetical protein
MEIFEEKQEPIQSQGTKLKVEDRDTNLSPSEEAENSSFESTEDQLSEKSGIEQEQNQELSEKWVERWMPEEIVDKYALSYEKSKKSPEEKRKNKKYQKYYQKGQDTKKVLENRLDGLLHSDKIEKDSSEEKIKEKILEILKSDIRATRLVKIIKEHNFDESTEKESEYQHLKPQVFSVPGLSSLKNAKNKSEANSVVDNSENQKGPGKEPGENLEELISSTDSIPPSDPDKPPKKNEKTEIPKTEKDFFKKFEKYGSYFDPQDGSEFKILGYDPAKQEVKIYKYQSFVYNKEKEAWGAPDKKGGEETFNYQEFLDLVKKSVSDSEYFEDQKIDIEKEKTQEKEELGGFYINDRGEYFKQKYYLKSKAGNKYASEEGEIEVEFDPRIKTSKNTFKTSELKDFIKKGRFDFYEKETDIKKSFKEEFGGFEDSEKLKILSFDYRPSEGKYLAEIEEKGQSRFVNAKDLRVLIKKMEDEKKNQNEIVLKNHFKQAEVSFIENALVSYVKNYKEELDEYLINQEDILGKDLLGEVEIKYMDYFWNKVLFEKLDSIKDIIPQDKQKLVFDYLKNQFKQIK